jgi:hypothetical protein
VVDAETTKSGLICIVKAVFIRVTGIVWGVGGLVEVFRTSSCGLVNVIHN